jgi:hypothetical protein
MAKKAVKEVQDVSATEQFKKAHEIARLVFSTATPNEDQVFAIYDYVLEDFADDEDEQKAVINDLLGCVDVAKAVFVTETPSVDAVVGIYERVFVEEE